MTCPVCGTVAVPGARFCHSCGSALPAAASLPAAERRVVTVLFGDLSDFTAWAAIGAASAGAGTAAATRRVASWRALRPLRLKGKREPVEAYELLGLLGAPGTRSGLGDEAPFVGRETELGRVAGRLAEVVDRGEPRILVTTGEAGLGQTRVAAQVERFA